MKMTRTLLLVVVAAVLLGMAGWSVSAQKKKVTRTVWEYKELTNGSTQQMDALGADGWEMVGFAVDDIPNKYMVFKRAK